MSIKYICTFVEIFGDVKFIFIPNCSTNDVIKTRDTRIKTRRIKFSYPEENFRSVVHDKEYNKGAHNKKKEAILSNFEKRT